MPNINNGITVKAEISFTDKKVNVNSRNILAKKVSRLAQMINKRIARLEKNNLQMVSAYKEYERQGKPHYGVKGKDYNQLQSEYWKLRKIADNITSTVKGANRYLNNMGKRLGFNEAHNKSQYEDLKANLQGYWRVYHRIEEYLSTLQNEGFNIGSPRMQEVLSEYVINTGKNLKTTEELNYALTYAVRELNDYMQISSEIEDIAVNIGLEYF